jgi:hypothetical protein
VSDHGAYYLSPVAAMLQDAELRLAAEQRFEAGQGYWLVIGEDEPDSTRVRTSHDVTQFARLEGSAVQADASGDTELFHPAHPR